MKLKRISKGDTIIVNKPSPNPVMWWNSHVEERFIVERAVTEGKLYQVKSRKDILGGKEIYISSLYFTKVQNDTDITIDMYEEIVFTRKK